MNNSARIVELHSEALHALVHKHAPEVVQRVVPGWDLNLCRKRARALWEPLNRLHREVAIERFRPMITEMHSQLAGLPDMTPAQLSAIHADASTELALCKALGLKLHSKSTSDEG